MRTTAKLSVIVFVAAVMAVSIFAMMPALAGTGNGLPVDTVASTQSSTQYPSLTYGIGIQSVSYEKPRYYADSWNIGEREIACAKSLGVKMIRVDIEKDTYNLNIADYDRFFNTIRDNGFKLFICILPPPGWATMSLANYDNFAVSICQRYRPDIAGVYTEVPNPKGTFLPRIIYGRFYSNSQWDSNLRNLTSRIHSVSSTTRVGVTTNMGKLGNVGFDIESNFWKTRLTQTRCPCDWVGVEPYVPNEISSIGIYVNSYWDGNVPLWISESDYFQYPPNSDDDVTRQQMIQLIITLIEADHRNWAGYVQFCCWDSGWWWGQCDYQHMGLVNRDWTFKQSWFTYKNHISSS